MPSREFYEALQLANIIDRPLTRHEETQYYALFKVNFS